MGDKKISTFDLGRSGTVVFHLSEDTKRLLIEFKVDEKGLTKTGVNGLVQALKDVREAMIR
jgi:hypothetical protein